MPGIWTSPPPAFLDARSIKEGILMHTRLLAGGTLAACLFGAAQPANAACIAINTVAQLEAIKNNLAGDFCLQKDIDLSSRPNFIPIGGIDTPFTGKFSGGGHAIRNLTTERALQGMGLFGA